MAKERRLEKKGYTIFTLSVEKTIKGDINAKDVFIRVEGGFVADAAFSDPPPWEWYFTLSDRILVSLHSEDDDLYTLSAQTQSVLWIKGLHIKSIHSLKERMGRVCKILRENNIPIALDEPCAEPTFGKVPIMKD